MNEATIKISQEFQSILGALDKLIEEIAGERVAFTLMVFTEGRASYGSTCSREESIREIKYLLELWGEGMPDIKAHDVT